MKNALVSLLLLFLLSCTAFAADRGPSTPEERARAVKAAELVQKDPLSQAARTEREWGILWLIQVPDISVTACVHPKEPKKYKFAGELMAANMMSMATFIIEHPEQAKDNRAVWKAGQRGILRAYEAIVKANAKAKNSFYDDMLQQESKDGLQTFIEQMSSHCSGGGAKLAVKE